MIQGYDEWDRLANEEVFDPFEEQMNFLANEGSGIYLEDIFSDVLTPKQESEEEDG